MREEHTYELQLCETCGQVVGTKKHLAWLAERMGPLAYTNPSLVLAQSRSLLQTCASTIGESAASLPEPSYTREHMRILCPQCKRRVSLQG